MATIERALLTWRPSDDPPPVSAEHAAEIARREFRMPTPEEALRSAGALKKLFPSQAAKWTEDEVRIWTRLIAHVFEQFTIQAAVLALKPESPQCVALKMRFLPTPPELRDAMTAIEHGLRGPVSRAQLAVALLTAPPAIQKSDLFQWRVKLRDGAAALRIVEQYAAKGEAQ